jgi:hypothetical protein
MNSRMRLAPLPPKKFAQVAMALSLAFACSGSGHPVARVDGAGVSGEEWQAFLRARVASGAAPDATAALQELARREVAFHLAQKKGLLASAGFKEQAWKNRRDILGAAFIASQPGSPPLTEAQAKEFYLAHNQERHVLHILRENREGADLVLVRLKSGEPFESVAKELSKDPSGKKNGGDLGWIRRQQVVKEFADAVFAAKEGELVGPFKSEFGWHVALVKETRGPTAEEFDKDKASFLKKMAQMQETSTRDQALGPLRQKYPLAPDREVLELDRTTEVAPGDEDRIAGRVGGETISLKELKAYIGDVLSTSGQSHSLGAETKTRFMETLADDVRLSRAAVDAGLDRKPEVKADLWNRDRESALQAFSDSYLSTFQPPEQALQEHYSAHPDRFLELGSVHLYLSVSDSRDRADEALSAALRGAPWADVVGRFANRDSTGNWDMGWAEFSALQKFLPPATIKTMITKPPGHVLGPCPLPDGFAIFKVIERKPGPVRPFADCRDLVREDVLKERGSEIVGVFLDGDGRKGMKVETFAKVATLPREK